MKRLCSICSLREAQQYCKCSHEEMCADAGCISRHISESAGPHPFTPLRPTSSQQQSRTALHAYDVSTEVSQFIDREIMYLRHRKDEVKQAIETKALELCEEVQELAATKQQEVELLFDRLVEKVVALKSVSQKEKVRAVKWTNGHLFALNCAFNRVKLTEFVKLESKFLLNLREEKRFELAPARQSWWQCNGKVDAITLSFSKEVRLTAISIGKEKENSPPVALESLQILEGRSTQDREVYAHSEASQLMSSTPERVIVRLITPVPVSAQTWYTIKVRLKGGKISCAGPALRMPTQDSLTVRMEATQFAGGDESNGSGADAGVFFELFYQSCVDLDRRVLG